MHMLRAVCLCTVIACVAHVRGEDGSAGSGVTGFAGTNQLSSNEPVAVTPAGKLLGSWMTSRRGRRFEAYRGIPYAEPPVGELRFKPPRLILKYLRDVNASVDGPACPQPTVNGYDMDEDCLRLNVYTPRKDSQKPLPVVVFIHQGGFYSESGRSDLMGPQYMMDRDVVLVTINYRLASLGFISTGDEYAPGNNGFKDQVAALRWVQRNIAAFGGDPGCVTLTGYSAGSISIPLHMVSPMSRGLFHRAIAMSGSPFSQVEVGLSQRHLAEKQARLVGCPTHSSQAMMDCLRTVPWRELGDSLIGFAEFAYDPVLIWAAVIEPDVGQERFLPHHPLDALRAGYLHSVPLIVSQTRDEFFWKAFTVLRNETLTEQLNNDWYSVAPIPFLLPGDAHDAAYWLREAYLKGRPLANDSVTAYSLGRLYGDSVIGFGVHRLANLMCRVSHHPVYYYQFAYMGNHSFYEDPVTNRPTAVAHHDDLIYLFSLPSLFPDVGMAGADAEMVDKMTAIWYNFARFGNPNPRNDTPELAQLSWPPMLPAHRKYARIASNFTVLSNQAEERFELWDRLYPLHYDSFKKVLLHPIVSVVPFW